ncbi:MAG TPA: ChbG/HpnK family deacetylase [Phycisphaerae bacterium]|nr:ChbG/HpnK family deacetylase [Phycisphaerae bacterium]HPS52517.1 ChbG/HpnK family deacetylase [Phycisphaerae bacterium]
METGKKCKVIINGDDFGLSRRVSEGIIHAHKYGILTSATFQANGDASEYAASLLAEVPTLGVGVHLNISQGRCISKAGMKLADESGMMNHTAVGIIMLLLKKPNLLSAVREEFDAQIRRAVAMGIRPTHLDTHRHSHGFGPVCSIVAELAKKYNIPFIRRLGEHLPWVGWPKAPAKQKHISNILTFLGDMNKLRHWRFFRTAGTWGVAHTGCITREWLLTAAGALVKVCPCKTIEIMTHPGYCDDLDESVTRLIESRQIELAALCDDDVRKAFDANGIERINYGNL